MNFNNSTEINSQETSKPDNALLQHYYNTNRSYFDQLANYYFQHDKDYYNNSIMPFYVNLQQGEIKCPFCQKHGIPKRISKISTGGIVMIVVGLVFTTVLIGIILIIIGAGMKENYNICPNCNLRLGY